MGKKRNKKENSLASNQSNMSIKDHSFNDQSSCNISANDSHENLGHLKILLCENIDEKDKYYRWTKDCSWRNIAFIHPSVLHALCCGDYLFIKGTQTSAVFIAYPLKTVKRSSVVLLNDMGFEHEELVTVDPFEGEGYEAEEISLVLPSEFDASVNITDLLWKKLSNRFIWPGLKLELVFFDTKYEFTVTSIKSTGQVLLRNFSKNAFFLNQTSNCDISNLSEPAKANDCNISESELHLSSIFQSMTLQDSKNYNRSEMTKTPSFFIVSHHTSILFCGKIDKDERLKCPLFEHIGGYQKEIERIQNYVNQFLELAKETLTQRHMLLLTGALGSGKTMMLKAICNEYDIHAEEIERNSLYCKEPSEAIKEINQKFKNVTKRTPSFLLLDEFDRLCPSKMESHSRISDALCNLIAKCDTNTLILAAVTTDSGYDKNLLNYFSVQEIKFSLPSTFEREEILGKILSGMKHELSSDQIKKCAEYFQGMSGKDIFRTLKYDGPLLSLIRMGNTVVDEAANEAVLTFCDIKTAVKRKKSHIMSSNLKTEKVQWSDIGGMEVLKEKLKEEIELSQMSPENIKRFNYSPSRGILFYGPPGCSKTMIAKALATECNWNFISKKASDILNMYVGESEKAVTNLFLEARVRAPCIIFLDEIDALAPERSSTASASGVGNRIVNALLTEMAGIETLKDVMVIAATNRPNIIDKALLRHGRIGQHIYVPLPDSATRKEIFKLSMKRRQVADDVNFNYLVEKTDGYTGAEIVHLCNEAAMQILTEDPECNSPVFQMKHFERALLAVLPRTPKETIQFYEQFSLNN